MDYSDAMYQRDMLIGGSYHLQMEHLQISLPLLVSGFISQVRHYIIPSLKITVNGSVSICGHAGMLNVLKSECCSESVSICGHAGNVKFVEVRVLKMKVLKSECCSECFVITCRASKLMWAEVSEFVAFFYV